MLSRLGWLADRLLEIAAVLLMLAMLGAVFFGVVFRFLNRPLTWSDELSTYLLVWVGFVGWIVAGNRRSHIRVRVLLDRLPATLHRWAEVAIQLLVLGFGLVLLTRSFGLIQRNLDVTWVTLPLSVALVYVPIPIAGFAVVCQSLVAIARTLRGELDDPEEGLPLSTGMMFEILAVWLVALLVGVPLYVSLGLAAVAFVWLAGMPPDIVPQKLAQSINSFPLLAAPLFILMGNIMNSAGITDRIFTFATACVGWVRGGLCHANILASVIFAGMSGSAVADAGGVGTLEIRAMKKEGYDAETAAAITAASATIGPIIPPSLPMVIYGVSADVSIGGLFLAGIIPGLMMAGALAAMVSVVAIRRDLPRHPFPGLRDVWVAYKRAHWALMTPVILFGGMMAGIMTPTEAAAVATVYALFLGLVIYRDFDLRELPKLIVETIETTGIVLALVMTAAALAWCLSIARVPQTLTPLIVEHIDNPILYLLAVNVLLLLIGCFMEALAAMLILIPILTPVAAHLGIDPIQFGVVFVLNLMIGTITPPVGVVLFITSRIAGISFEAMSRAIVPWLIPLIAVLLAISLWPPLTTWLPGLFFN